MKNKRINLLLILCFSLIFFITSFDCSVCGRGERQFEYYTNL